MILRGWSIDSFGGLGGAFGDGLDSGLNVVTGANEAGKSTLWRFFAGVVSGSGVGGKGRPSRRGPISSGRAIVELDGERYALPYDDDAPDEVRAKLEGIVDPHVYRAVYTIELDDLHALTALTDVALRERLFCAGLFGAGGTAGEIERALTRDLGELVRPRGSSRVGDVVARLDENSRALRRARTRLARHGEIRRTESELGDRLAAIERDLVHVESEISIFERVEHLRPIRRELEQCLRELTELSSTGSVSEELGARWTRLEARRSELEASLARLDEERTSCEQRRGRVESRAAAKVATLAPEIERLAAERARWRADGEALAELDDRLRADETALERAMARWERVEARRSGGETDGGLRPSRIRLEHVHVELPPPTLRRELSCWEERLERTRARSPDAAVSIGRDRTALLGDGSCSRWLAIGAGVAAAAVAGSPGVGDALLWTLLTGVTLAIVVLLARSAMPRRRPSGPSTTRQPSADRQATVAAWRRWRRAHRLPGGVSPRRAKVWLERAWDARHAAARRDSTRAERDRRRGAVDDWITRAREVCDAVGIEFPAGVDDQCALVARLESDAVQAGSAKVELAKLEIEIRRIDSQNRVLCTRVESTERAQRQLLAAANAENGADLEEKIAGSRQRAELERAAGRLERQLDVALDGRRDAPRLRDELARGDSGARQGERSRLDREHRRLSSERDETIRRHRDAERARRELEESTDVAGLELERTALETELRELSRAWHTVAFARTLLRKTIERSAERRQRDVLVEASAMLREISAGRYTDIVCDSSRREIALLDGRGARVETAVLSRGTVEQLYLVLRLALVLDHGRRGVSLPVLLDDVLVHSDPARAAALVRILQRVAENHQTILFSCHPAVRRLLERHGARVVALERGSVVERAAPAGSVVSHS